MWCHLSAKLHLSLVTTFSHTYPWLSVILFLHLIIYLLEAVGFLTLGDSSPFGLTKSDMTALQPCFGFPSSVTVNSTIFFPPPPGSTCYGKVSFDCSLPYLKMIVGLFCTSFFFFFFYWVFLCYVCFLRFLPRMLAANKAITFAFFSYRCTGNRDPLGASDVLHA